MRIAYADPPYPGQARKHYRNDPSGIPAAEVDHAALIAQLESEYDGWALSTSEPALQLVLPLCPAGVRVLPWCKSWASWKKVNPPYEWEPVIIKLPRKASEPSKCGYYVSPVTTRTGTHGAKPPGFYYWLFTAMNLRGDDTLDDKYPGSGSCGRAWETWRKQAPRSKRTRTPRPRQQDMWQEISA